MSGQTIKEGRLQAPLLRPHHILFHIPERVQGNLGLYSVCLNLKRALQNKSKSRKVKGNAFM